MNSSLRERRFQSAIKVGVVMIRLSRSNVAMRRAARRAGDGRMAQRLRRIADRRRAAADELLKITPTLDADAAVEILETAPVLPEEIQAAASKIGSLAACLRANQRLRIAIGRALEADLPNRIRPNLERLRDQTDLDWGSLNAQFRDLVVLTVPIRPEAGDQHVQ